MYTSGVLAGVFFVHIYLNININITLLVNSYLWIITGRSHPAPSPVYSFPSFGAAESCDTNNKGLTPHQRDLYNMKNSFV